MIHPPYTCITTSRAFQKAFDPTATAVREGVGRGDNVVSPATTAQPSAPYSKDFEDLTLRMLRQAAERQQLEKKLREEAAVEKTAMSGGDTNTNTTTPSTATSTTNGNNADWLNGPAHESSAGGETVPQETDGVAGTTTTTPPTITTATTTTTTTSNTSTTQGLFPGASTSQASLFGGGVKRQPLAGEKGLVLPNSSTSSTTTNGSGTIKTSLENDILARMRMMRK